MDFALDSAELIVQVNLEYIPATTEGIKNSNISNVNLIVKTTSTDPTSSVVSLVTTNYTVDPTGQAVSILGKDTVEDVIPALVIDWLNDNLSSFAHVFCTVELNKYIDKDAGWKWTKPTDVGYAYNDGISPSNSVLGILCMTGGRKRTVQQTDVVDPGAIPSGSIAGFLVQDKLFLEELILPTIPLQWPAAKVDDFEIVPNGNTKTGKYEWVLQLKTGSSFDIPPVNYKDGSGNDVSNTPSMKTLTISTDGQTLTMSAYTETDVGMGVTAWNSSTHQYTIVLGTNNKGKQTIQYKTFGTPVTSHGAHKTEGAKIFEWMMIAVGVIATIVLGVMTDGAAFVVGALIIGALTGIAADAPDIVKTVDSGDAPSTDLLSFNTTSPIIWANSKVFKLTLAQLNGPFQMGGNPNFSPT
jgi:hypothetical protein